MIMNRETAYNQINSAFDKMSFDDSDENRNMCLSLLREVRPAIQFMHDEYANDDDDCRSGEETYGVTHKDVIKDLWYVSDRWMCRFRTRWLLDLIDYHFRGMER